MKIIHPAIFSDQILELVSKKHLLPLGRVLDPMAGTGRIHFFGHEQRLTVGVEIEMPWAAARKGNICGNAKHLPFPDESFDAAFCSPCYGSRMSDHHNAQDGSRRRSYTHDLRRMMGDDTLTLHPDNTGTLSATQIAYWDLHARAWRELHRVLKPGAPFILNVSDHIRKGNVVAVVDQHQALCEKTGFVLVEEHSVATPRMRFGANSKARVPVEKVLVFQKGADVEQSFRITVTLSVDDFGDPERLTPQTARKFEELLRLHFGGGKVVSSTWEAWDEREGPDREGPATHGAGPPS